MMKLLNIFSWFQSIILCIYMRLIKFKGQSIFCNYTVDKVICIIFLLNLRNHNHIMSVLIFNSHMNASSYFGCQKYVF